MTHSKLIALAASILTAAALSACGSDDTDDRPPGGGGRAAEQAAAAPQISDADRQQIEQVTRDWLRAATPDAQSNPSDPERLCELMSAEHRDKVIADYASSRDCVVAAKVVTTMFMTPLSADGQQVAESSSQWASLRDQIILAMRLEGDGTVTVVPEGSLEGYTLRQDGRTWKVAGAREINDTTADLAHSDDRYEQAMAGCVTDGLPGVLPDAVARSDMGETQDGEAFELEESLGADDIGGSTIRLGLEETRQGGGDHLEIVTYMWKDNAEVARRQAGRLDSWYGDAPTSLTVIGRTLVAHFDDLDNGAKLTGEQRESITACAEQAEKAIAVLDAPAPGAAEGGQAPAEAEDADGGLPTLTAGELSMCIGVQTGDIVEDEADTNGTLLDASFSGQATDAFLAMGGGGEGWEFYEFDSVEQAGAVVEQITAEHEQIANIVVLKDGEDTREDAQEILDGCVDEVQSGS